MDSEKAAIKTQTETSDCHDCHGVIVNKSMENG